MPNWSGLSKNLALWLLVALLAVTLFQLMQKRAGGSEVLSYTEFSRQIDAGNIKAVEKVDLRATGSVDGDITAPRFVMADGATVMGKVQAG